MWKVSALPTQSLRATACADQESVELVVYDLEGQVLARSKTGQAAPQVHWKASAATTVYVVAYAADRAGAAPTEVAVAILHR